MEKLVPVYNFMVCFGPLKVGFSKISGISNELSVDTIVEGGVNDRMIPLYTPKKMTGTLVFQHGIGIFNHVNQIFEAASFGKYISMPGVIFVYDRKQIKRVYYYEGVVPIKWSLSDLDALNGSVIIDTVEVIHQGIYEVPYPLL